MTGFPPEDEDLQYVRTFKKQEPAHCGVTGEAIDFNRYIVVKRDNLNYLSQHKQNMLAGMLAEIRDARKSHGLKEEPWRVVITEGMDCYAQATELLAAEIKGKSSMAVQDRLIRTPSKEDLRMVAGIFLAGVIHINTDDSKYGGADLLIPHGEGFVPWNPWNDPEQAMHLSVHVRARAGYDDNGLMVEYWDQPLTQAEKDSAHFLQNQEYMRTVSCKQHEESGFSLAFARKLTQVAVYRAHRIEGTV